MTNEQLALKNFLDNHYNPDTNNLEINESEHSLLIELIADTLPDDKREEFIIEKEYTRIWNILNNARFDSDYHKNQLFQNLFEQKINDYKISLAMDYIQNNLNLSTDQYNSLTEELTQKATQLALTNDSKELNELKDDLNNYLIDNFQNIFGFDPSNAGSL